MPTYAYRGTECGHEFEIYQSFSDDPLTQCPTCGAPVRKVVSGVGVTFKGSGFYRTDSRSESRSAEKTSSPASSTSSSGSAGSSTSGSSSSSSESSSTSTSGKKAAAS